jgi:general secretion pathway protein J
MKRPTVENIHRRVARRRRGEEGLTIIELLLSLTLLVLLTGFLAGGLSITRHAFDSSRVIQVGGEADSALQAISGLVGSAISVPAGTTDQPTGVFFDGDPNHLSFVGVSEGRSLRGGPYKINVRRAGSDLIIDLTPLSSTKPDQAHQPPVNAVVLTGVRGLHFSYFGQLTPTAEPIWRTEWHFAEALPNLVSLQIDFEDERRNEPAMIVALRQG